MIGIKNKSQAAVELIVILAIALVIFIAILSVNDDITSSISNKFEVTKAKTSLEDLANAAELVYQQGTGAKTQVYITLPNNVNSVSIAGQILNINMYAGGNPRDVYRTVDFQVAGNIPTEEGSYLVAVEAFDTYVGIGELTITCPDGVCNPGENCPADTTACPDNICYNPNCINGCGQVPITNAEDPSECDSTIGCALPPCYCDSSSNCVSAPIGICSNNIKEGTEVCDGTDLAGQTCISQGFDGGNLACLGDCTGFDTTSCFNYICGNNLIEGTEICDGTNLAGQTCQLQGFDAGTLTCLGDCSAFDTSGCYDYVCSNNIKEGTEICDGTDLAGQTCISQGFDGGNLACLGDCTGFDTSSCYTISCQEFYATAFEQSGATNPINVQGVPDNLYAILPTNANWVRGTGFSTATGTITSVEMAMDYHRVGTYANDIIRLSYLIGAAAGATTQDYYDSPSDITVYKDVTADRAWAWSDITNMKVEASFRKSGAVDNLDWYVDGLWVRVCHT